MSRRYILTALLVLMLFTHHKSHAQHVVRDKYKQRQLENMVFIRWGKFRPRWYYFLFHRKYRNGPDRRTMLQLIPTKAAATHLQRRSEDEQKDVRKMYTMETWDALNRMFELHYIFYFRQVFDNLNKDIGSLISVGVGLETDPRTLHAFRKEQERLNNEIEIIRNGWLEKGESAEAMQDIETDLRVLKGRLIRFNELQTIQRKYETRTN